MEEQLIDFETAKLAKDRGFTIPTHSYYFEDGEFREHALTGTNGYYGDEYKFELSEFNENWNDTWLTKKNGGRCFGCSKDRGYFETFSAPTQSLLQRWLRETHNIHINIRYEEYVQQNIGYKFFHYDISNGVFTDVTENQELFGDLLEECSEEIPGNHLNDEEFSKLIFDRNFAFKTYEDALEHGLQEALKLIDDGKH